MRFKCRFLKKKFLLLLITLGIGSALYANDELKSLADSLRRMIDEKPLFIQQKEQRINRIKCLLKGSGLTLEQKYKINFQLCNEYKKFVVDSAIHYVDQNLEIARKLNNRDLKNQSFLQLSLLYSMCGRYRDAELILEEINFPKIYYLFIMKLIPVSGSITLSLPIVAMGSSGQYIRIHYYLFWIKLLLIINYPGHIIMEGAIP